MSKTYLNIDKIAKIAHKAHNSLCIELGHSITKWNELAYQHVEIIKESAEKILSGEYTSAEDSHKNFVKMKKANGWKFGFEYSLVEKTNPRVIDFEALSPNEILKEQLFFNTVKAFLK